MVERAPAPVEVWLAELDPPAPAPELTPEERERAARFRFDEDRDRWVRSRAVARRILARRVGIAPAEVPWTEGPRGKPRLGGSLDFNLSHSGPLFALALSSVGPVGVDLEVVEPLPRMERVAARVFSEEEWAPAEGFDREGRVRFFYRLWTAKEAVLKYLGTGLSLEPTAVVLETSDRGGPLETPRVLRVRSDAWPASAVRLVGFTFAGAVGAVVWRGGPGAPVFRAWPRGGEASG